MWKISEYSKIENPGNGNLKNGWKIRLMVIIDADILLIINIGVLEIVRFVMSRAICPLHNFITRILDGPSARRNLKHEIINNTEYLHIK